MNSNTPLVYLIKMVNDDKTLYKIGITKNKISTRIKNIQTGCPYKIEIVDTYVSEYSRMIEKTLHNYFSYNHTHGEWFELSCSEEFKFKSMCEKYENIFQSMEKIKNNNR